MTNAEVPSSTSPTQSPTPDNTSERLNSSRPRTPQEFADAVFSHAKNWIEGVIRQWESAPAKYGAAKALENLEGLGSRITPAQTQDAFVTIQAALAACAARCSSETQRKDLESLAGRINPEQVKIKDVVVFQDGTININFAAAYGNSIFFHHSVDLRPCASMPANMESIPAPAANTVPNTVEANAAHAARVLNGNPAVDQSRFVVRPDEYVPKIGL